MEKEITIENLSQEVTDLKLQIEAKDAEIEKLKTDVKEENGFRKMYDNLYSEILQKYNSAKSFLNTISLLLETTSEEGTEIATTARVNLIKSAIDKFLKQ